MLTKSLSAASQLALRGEEMTHGGVGPHGLLGLVRGHANISCSCPWCDAIEAMLPQRLAGLWRGGDARSARPLHQAGLGCREMGLLRRLYPAFLCTVLLHYFGVFFSPKSRAEKCKGPWKWKPKWEENIPMGFRGNCCWSREYCCQPNRNEPFIWDFGQNWSWFFGRVWLLPLPIHTWMPSTLQKGFHQPLRQSPQAWENGCETTGITNTNPNHTHIPHPSYTRTSKQVKEGGEDEWKL